MKTLSIFGNALFALFLCVNLSSCDDDSDNEINKGDIHGTVAEFVDMGFPSGVLWASHNVGASKPEERGDMFAWGEIKPKKSYTKENSLTYGKKISNIAGNPLYDAANANWGGSSRLPTVSEFKELVKYTEHPWTEQNGVKGRMFTSKINGNSIFLPHTKLIPNEDLDFGEYWSSEPGDINSAGLLSFWQYNIILGWFDRYKGYVIRPVKDK